MHTIRKASPELEAEIKALKIAAEEALKEFEEKLAAMTPAERRAALDKRRRQLEKWETPKDAVLHTQKLLKRPL